MSSLVWSTPPSPFIDDLEEYVAQYTLNLAKIIFKKAVAYTPVHSGELRASWNLSYGAPDYTTEGHPDKSPRHPVSVSPKPRVPPFSPRKGAIWYVTNGKRYADYVEFGTPKMWPKLMLTRAIEEAEQVPAEGIMRSFEATRFR